jgi:hypothetical protein
MSNPDFKGLLSAADPIILNNATEASRTISSQQNFDAGIKGLTQRVHALEGAPSRFTGGMAQIQALVHSGYEPRTAPSAGPTAQISMAGPTAPKGGRPSAGLHLKM